MASTAFGLTTPDGRDPALYASTAGPPSMRANASAIWLRLAFSTHTNSSRLTVLMPTPPRPPTVAATGIGQKQQFGQRSVTLAAQTGPPRAHAGEGDGRCIRRQADADVAAVGQHVVAAVRHGPVRGVLAEVVAVDFRGLP